MGAFCCGKGVIGDCLRCDWERILISARGYGRGNFVKVSVGADLVRIGKDYVVRDTIESPYYIV